MSNFSNPPASSQQLREDIDFYQSLLNSIEDEKDCEDERQHYSRMLRRLRERLRAAGMVGDSSSSDEVAPETVNRTSAFNTSNHSDSNDNTSAYPKVTVPNIALPSRKRDRSSFDNDESVDQPLPKSRRTTPTNSPTLSAVDSIDSDYFNDPTLGNLLGEDWRNDVRSNKKYLEELEEKKRQQAEDEQLARRLQEEWSQESARILEPQPSRPTAPNFPMGQSFLQPDGSYKAPASQASVLTGQARSSSNLKPPSPAITLDSSDDDLAFSSAADFRSRFPSSTTLPRTLPPSFATSSQMPGAFPGSAIPTFASRPGASVYTGYNQLNSFNQATPSKGPGQASGLTGIGSQWNRGSSAHPFDVDRLNTPPLPPYWATEEYADPKETQEEIRQLLKHIRPDEEISPDDPSQVQPDGLREKLMPHQLKGVAWMKKMEEGSNKGGILADDMGLGKTIQAIALMLERPREGRIRKPTLVVAPVALIEQWKREISKMVKRSHQFNVATLYGSRARTSFSEISTYDVVMTTYGTLTSELKRLLKWEEKLKLLPDAKPTKLEQCPMLGKDSIFHRVILDEAQYIKNKNTRAAHAACRLRAEHRWCLSGTPMQNSVDEIYSLIKFCRIRPYNDIEKFNRDIARPLKARWESAKERAMQQLQALLKAILLRRTKISEIDGKPILQLPQKHIVEDRAIFNKDEFDFYKAMETQARIEFNKYLKKGTVGQNHARALVLLLRLRQCCCSPQLITNTKDFMVDTCVEGVDLLANAAELPLAVIDRLKEETDTECPICMDGVLNPVIFNPCGHTLCQDCLSKMVDNVMQEASDCVKCPHCRARIDTNKITDYESFMKVHGPETLEQPQDGEETASEDSEKEVDDEDGGNEDDEGDEEAEEDDSEELADLKDFIVPDEEELSEYSDDENKDRKQKVKKPSSDDETDSEEVATLSSRRKGKKVNKVDTKGDDSTLEENKEASSKFNKKARKRTRSTKKKGKRKAKDAFKSLADLRKEGLRNQSAKKHYIKQLAKGYVPSAKIMRTLELLQEIKDRAEDEKTIIFSSFTSFLDLLEVPLSRDEELGNYARYDGSMTAKDRNRAVLRFTDDPNCKVILVSIKAGNAGLNLTAANHVIILDPFWNPYVEYQAADRCYRIGQRKEVTVHRVLIGEEGFDHAGNPDYQFTVEDRILQLQEKKRQLVESALDEHSTSAIARLGTRELGYLFGVNDMDGRMITNH